MIGTRSTRRSRLIAQLVATVVVIPFAFPLVTILVTSFGGEGAVANYAAVISETPFLRFALNSLVIAVGTVALVYACTMSAGYAFAKMQFRGKSLLFNAILVGLILPTLAIIVPIFITVQRLGLFSNPIAVIVPLSATLVPFTLLLARNYLVGIPDEILEAARVDGATSFGTLIRIVIPLSAPISAVVVVWAFLQAWNDLFLPLLILQDEDARAITQVPLYFTSQYGSDVPKIFASLVLLSLPIVIAYLALQKLFERGLTAGAVK
ncbi:carbohydrate ABC transporter permease [Occultella gossypii]|uniref:Carbohydrate ABC transporter permease n=1 Tax=Occultella gossypii TaxID=2800820 RepID=A0ABS7SFP5_9MICO|nr:carbohydrate ABC transporter permease [Occultella gossypii]MBZ2198965.1 carbohydrate ABC transporter permease [Occultella gossypii]